MATGTELETSLAKLETIADTDAVSIGQFSDELKVLSSQTGQSASDLANVAYNAISAGTATEDAMEMVETATKLAVGGFTNADSALSVLTTSINAYGEAVGTAEEIADSLVMVQNLGVTTVGDLASSMGKAIATGSAYNISLGNIESAYVSLTKGGIATAEATTYMSSMFSELGDSGSKAAGILMDETGKSFSDLMNEGYTLADVLGILYEASGEDATALMNMWGSAEAGKAANAILNQGLDEFNANLETITGTAGATENAYSIMADTVESQISRLSESLKNIGSTVYEDVLQGGVNEVLGLAQGYVDTLAAAFEAEGLEGLVGALGNILADIVTKAAEYAPMLLDVAVMLLNSLIDGLNSNSAVIIAAIINICDMLISSILSMMPTLLQLGINVIVQLAVGIAQALPRLIPTITSVIVQMVGILIDNIPLLIDAAVLLLEGLVEGIIAALPVLIDALPELVQSIMEALLECAPLLIDCINQLIFALVAALPEIITGIINILPVLANTINAALIESLPLFLDAVSQIVAAIVVNLPLLCSAIIDALPAILDAIITTLVVLSDMLWTDVLLPCIEAVLQWIVDMETNAKEGIANFISAIITFFEQLPEKIGYWLGYIVVSIYEWVESLIDTIEDTVPAVIDSIIIFFAELPDKAWDWLLTTISKIVTFCTNAKNSAKEGMQEMVDAIIEKISTLPDKMIDIGVNIVEGLWEGIKSAKDWIIDKIVGFCDGLIDGAKDALGIHSPSTIFKWIGKMCVAGFDEGMEDFADADTMERNIKATLDTLSADMAGETQPGTSFTANFYDTQTDPDAITRKFYSTMRYGLAGV